MTGKDCTSKRTRKALTRILVLTALLVATCAISAQASAAAATPNPGGIDFDALVAQKSSLYFGSYSHAKTATFGTSASAGTQTFDAARRPVPWRVAGIEGGRLILLSDYVLDTARFANTPVSGSFNYAGSGIANYLNTTMASNLFTAAEKDPALMPLRTISTSLYDSEAGSLIDAQTGPVSWPQTRTGDTLSLPWARSLTLAYPQTGQIYFSDSGKTPGSSLIDAAARPATLRAGGGTVPYWTRSPHLEAGTSPALNTALYVRDSSVPSTSGFVTDERTDAALGIRPLIALDTSCILDIQKVADIPANSTQIASDGVRDSFDRITTDGNYFELSDELRPGASNYKLTVLNPQLALNYLTDEGSGTQIAPGSTETLALTPGTTLTLSAAITGNTNSIAYRIANAQGAVVARGTSPATLATIPMTAFDGTTPLPTGTYTAVAWAHKENAASSNEGSAPITFTLILDSDRPSTSAFPVPAGSWYRGYFDVLLNAQDASSGVAALRWQLNDTQSVYASGSAASVTLDSDGRHTISYAATDKAGNVETTKTAVYAIDTKVPVSSISPEPGSYQPLTVEISSVDDTSAATGGIVSGVDNIYYRIGGGAEQTYTGPIDLSEDGTYLISYFAKDKAGNIEAPKLAIYTVKKQTAADALVVQAAQNRMLLGHSLQLHASLSPAHAESDLIWTSSDQTIATVSKDGLVHAQRAGSVTITATAAYGGASTSFTIVIESPVTSFAATHKKFYLTVGKTANLPLIAYGAEGCEATINWATRKYAPATITQNTGAKGPYEYAGSFVAQTNEPTFLRIRGNKKGTSRLTFTSQNGVSYTVTVMVVPKKAAKKVSSVKMTALPKKLTLEAQTTRRLKVSFKNKKATNVIAKWKSSRPDVISVDATGRVTAHRTGTATISVKMGKKTVKKKIKVIKWK